MNPVVKQGSCVFREECNGFASFTPLDPRQRTTHFLNPLARKVFMLCTGQQSVHDITSQLAVSYPSVKLAQIKTDVVECLTRLEEAGVILWDGNDEERGTVQGGKLRIYVAGEADVRRMSEFLKSIVTQAQNGIDAQVLLLPSMAVDAYEAPLLRMQMFHLLRVCVVAEEEGKVRGILGVSINGLPSKVVNLSLLAMSEGESKSDLVSELLDALADLLKKNCYTKIRYVLTPENAVGELVSFLSNHGFSKECTLLHEFGPGRNGDVLSRFIN